jgi:hypothetical protein
VHDGEDEQQPHNDEHGMTSMNPGGPPPHEPDHQNKVRGSQLLVAVGRWGARKVREFAENERRYNELRKREREGRNLATRAQADEEYERGLVPVPDPGVLTRILDDSADVPIQMRVQLMEETADHWRGFHRTNKLDPGFVRDRLIMEAGNPVPARKLYNLALGNPTMIGRQIDMVEDNRDRLNPVKYVLRDAEGNPMGTTPVEIDHQYSSIWMGPAGAGKSYSGPLRIALEKSGLRLVLVADLTTARTIAPGLAVMGKNVEQLEDGVKFLDLSGKTIKPDSRHAAKWNILEGCHNWDSTMELTRLLTGPQNALFEKASGGIDAAKYFGELTAQFIALGLHTAEVRNAHERRAYPDDPSQRQTYTVEWAFDTLLTKGPGADGIPKVDPQTGQPILDPETGRVKEWAQPPTPSALELISQEMRQVNAEIFGVWKPNDRLPDGARVGAAKATIWEKGAVDALRALIAHDLTHKTDNSLWSVINTALAAVADRDTLKVLSPKDDDPNVISPSSFVHDPHQPALELVTSYRNADRVKILNAMFTDRCINAYLDRREEHNERLGRIVEKVGEDLGRTDLDPVRDRQLILDTALRMHREGKITVEGVDDLVAPPPQMTVAVDELFLLGNCEAVRKAAELNRKDQLSIHTTALGPKQMERELGRERAAAFSEAVAVTVNFSSPRSHEQNKAISELSGTQNRRIDTTTTTRNHSGPFAAPVNPYAFQAPARTGNWLQDMANEKARRRNAADHNRYVAELRRQHDAGSSSTTWGETIMSEPRVTPEDLANLGKGVAYVSVVNGYQGLACFEPLNKPGTWSDAIINAGKQRLLNGAELGAFEFNPIRAASHDQRLGLTNSSEHIAASVLRHNMEEQRAARAAQQPPSRELAASTPQAAVRDGGQAPPIPQELNYESIAARLGVPLSAREAVDGADTSSALPAPVELPSEDPNRQAPRPQPDPDSRTATQAPEGGSRGL